MILFFINTDAEIGADNDSTKFCRFSVCFMKRHFDNEIGK